MKYRYKRKAPVKVSGEQIYLDKENNCKNYVSDFGRQLNASVSKKGNTYYIMNCLSFDTRKYM